MSENQELISYIKRAFELKSQECYKQAIEMLYKALAIEPDNIELLFQTGELYFLLHNYSRASQYLEQVLSQNENHIPSLKLYKKIYIRQNEFIQAQELAHKIYNLEPEEKNLVEIIKISGKIGDFESVEQYLAEINNSDSTLYEYANALYHNSRVEEAGAIIQKALTINPENIDCKILSGKILFDRNEFEQAKEIFDEFGKEVQNPEILNYQGLFKLEEMNFIEAIKDFSKASNLDKANPKYFYNLGNAYFLNGWKDEAVAAYKNAIRILPDNLDYRYSLAYLYYEYKEFDKAQKEVDFILENDGNYYNAKVLKALLLFKNKNYLEAEMILLSNIKSGCEDDFTLASLAKIEMEISKFDSAEKHLKTIIERNSDVLTYQCDLADVYLKQKKYKEASNIAAKIIEMNKNYISGYILAAKSAYLAGDFDFAKSFAQEALALDINCAEGYYYLAMVRMKEEDFEEAVECMKRAITFDVTNAHYYAKMAEIYKLSGDTKTAFAYAKEAETIDNSEEYKILYKEFAALNRK